MCFCMTERQLCYLKLKKIKLIIAKLHVNFMYSILYTSFDTGESPSMYLYI